MPTEEKDVPSAPDQQTQRSTIDDRMDALGKELHQQRLELLEQEHRITHTTKNVLNHLFGDKDPQTSEQEWKERQQASIRALLWRFLLPLPAAAAGISILSIAGLYLAWQANALIDTQNNQIAAQTEAASKQNSITEAQNDFLHRQNELIAQQTKKIELQIEFAEKQDQKIQDQIDLSTQQNELLQQELGRNYFEHKRNLTQIIYRRHISGQRTCPPPAHKGCKKRAFALISSSDERGQAAVELSHLEQEMGTALMLYQTDLSNSSLVQGNFRSAQLQHSNLANADMVGTDLHGAFLSNSNMHRIDLHGAELAEAHIRGANLRYAILRVANLEGADLEEANLSHSRFDGANLAGAKLQNATITDADGYNAQLSNADLRGSKFSGTDLVCADLSYADLSNADLSGAFLKETKLEEATFNNTKCPDGSLSTSRTPQDCPATTFGTLPKDAKTDGAHWHKWLPCPDGDYSGPMVGNPNIWIR